MKKNYHHRKSHRLQRCEKDATFMLLDGNDSYDVTLTKDGKFCGMTTIYPEIRKLAPLQLKDGMIIFREKPRAKVLRMNIAGIELPKRMHGSTYEMQDAFEAYLRATSKVDADIKLKRDDKNAIKRYLAFQDSWKELFKTKKQISEERRDKKRIKNLRRKVKRQRTERNK
jgi:hypothetical protein